MAGVEKKRKTSNQSIESLLWSKLKMNKSMIHHSINMRSHLCPNKEQYPVCISGLKGFDYAYALVMLK